MDDSLKQNTNCDAVGAKKQKLEPVVEHCREAARDLIPELLRQFYHMQWVTGTGGGISIVENGKAFIAPSGVQKERVKPSDIFVTDLDGRILQQPDNKKLTLSQCTPMFTSAFRERGAGACIHSHSKHAVLVTMLNNAEFRIKDLEMIKAIRNCVEERNYYNYEEIIIPIIENTPSEFELKDSFQKALVDHPATSAVLVRNHGVYVFGPTWESTKSMAESYDYLFELYGLMHLHGLRK